MRSVCSMIVDREFGDAVILGNTETPSPSSPSTTAQAAGGGVRHGDEPAPTAEVRPDTSTTTGNVPGWLKELELTEVVLGLIRSNSGPDEEEVRKTLENLNFRDVDPTDLLEATEKALRDTSQEAAGDGVGLRGGQEASIKEMDGFLERMFKPETFKIHEEKKTGKRIELEATSSEAMRKWLSAMMYLYVRTYGEAILKEVICSYQGSQTMMSAEFMETRTSEADFEKEILGVEGASEDERNRTRTSAGGALTLAVDMFANTVFPQIMLKWHRDVVKMRNGAHGVVTELLNQHVQRLKQEVSERQAKEKMEKEIEQRRIQEEKKSMLQKAGLEVNLDDEEMEDTPAKPVEETSPEPTKPIEVDTSKGKPIEMDTSKGKGEKTSDERKKPIPRDVPRARDDVRQNTDAGLFYKDSERECGSDLRRPAKETGKGKGWFNRDSTAQIGGKQRSPVGTEGRSLYNSNWAKNKQFREYAQTIGAIPEYTKNKMDVQEAWEVLEKKGKRRQSDIASGKKGKNMMKGDGKGDGKGGKGKSKEEELGKGKKSRDGPYEPWPDWTQDEREHVSRMWGPQKATSKSDVDSSWWDSQGERVKRDHAAGARGRSTSKERKRDDRREESARRRSAWSTADANVPPK